MTPQRFTRKSLVRLNCWFSFLFWFASPAFTQVTLSEIMFDPLGNEFHDEFIELFNLSENDSVNLSHWRISDGSGEDELSDAGHGLVLAPRQFAIVLDPSYFENSTLYDSLIPAEALLLTIDNATFGSGGLSNSASEEISLLNPQGMVVSSYRYLPDNPMGFSDEKIIPEGADSADNWSMSMVLMGTPGMVNSVSPRQADLAIAEDAIRCEPPAPHAGDDLTLLGEVTNVGLANVSAFSVSLFRDDDRNRELSDSEEIERINFSQTIQAGDSRRFAFRYAAIRGGHHPFWVKINFPDDERLENNISSKTVDVAEKPGTLRINEIMYAPLSGDPEWVEIANPQTFAVPLYMWGLTDSGGETRAIVEHMKVLQPGELFVFAQDSSLLHKFDLLPGSYAGFSSWPSLNNNADTISLLDVTGASVDQVSYRDSWGGDRGVSLEKINPRLSANDSSNWSSSVALEGATPGRKNSLLVDILPSNARLTVEPNPFSPDGDGYDDFTIIQYDLPLTTAVANVKIYDLWGRLIRFLANNRPSAAHNELVWDGLDKNGKPARIGIYIVFLQALNATHGVLVTQKATVVLAKKL